MSLDPDSAPIDQGNDVPEDHPMRDVEKGEQGENTPPKGLKKRNAIHHTATLRKPQWTYFHLAAVSSTSEPLQLDILILRQNLTNALNQFLGLTGAAIDIDILKFEKSDAWIRVHREDASAVQEAISGWAGAKTSTGQYKWIIKGKDEWLVRLLNGDGMDLFKS